MSFCAHTKDEVQQMLQDLQYTSIDDLFKEIPQELLVTEIPGIAERLTEMEVLQLMQQRAKRDATKLNFIGAGCYEHYIPAAVWELASRGEFLTSYTPYQAEASQGTLQLLYEFQTMFANLTGLDVSNASLYDGATALAEAVLMAVRCAKNTHSRTVIVPKTVHPYYVEVVNTIVGPQNISIKTIDFDVSTGQTSIAELEKITEPFAALVIPQPNFFGVLEDVDQLTSWAHKHGGLVIALVNPMSLGLLKAPGQWGETGADIACGEAQSLGVPLASGGPYIGFLCCKAAYIRQLPGRLVGKTCDVDGNSGYTLTLQAREQHIRRAKATSNICTNQGLLATVVTIYLSLLGAKGLQQVALKSHANTTQLKELLQQVPGVKILFTAHPSSRPSPKGTAAGISPYFHELVLQFQKPIPEILDKLSKQGIQGGFDLSEYYLELGNALVCCVTETKTAEDLQQFVQAVAKC